MGGDAAHVVVPANADRPTGPLAALSVLAVAAYVTTLLDVATPQGVLFGALTETMFFAPGVLIARAAIGPAAGWLLPAALGPSVGMVMSSLTLLVLWAAGVRDAWALLAAPALAAPLAWPARRLQGRFTLVGTLGSDWPWLLALLLLVPIVVARPFSLVGADLPDGHAYRAYFTADYVWRRAVVAELAKGDFLPINPFYTGDTLHYYWLPHLLNALEYRVAGRASGLDPLLLMHSVIADGAFVAFLYATVRFFVSRPWAAAAGVACAILCSSFEGAYALWDHWRVGAPYGLIRFFNIDAVSRWLFGGMPIDGLQRVLLYQPHHAVGYAAGFLGLLLVARRTRRSDPAVFAVAGACLGSSLLISSFAGLMFTVMAALHEGLAVVRVRAWRRAWTHGVAAAVPLAVAAGLVTLLQYVDGRGHVILFGLNPVAAHNVLASTALSLGPMLLLAGAGAWVAWRHRRTDFLVFAAVVATCVVFYFFVDIRDHQDVYVGWRVGHVLLMTSAAAMALLWQRLGELSGFRRALALAGTAAVVVLALPTVVIDLYNTQDIENRQMGPGFRWTLVLSPPELEAFQWIKDHTPPDAVFQVDPIVRDSDTWAYLPAFAERRMAVGLPISMVPLAKYQRGSLVVRDMFTVSDAASLYRQANQLGVEYLLLGPPEREANPGLQPRLDSRADLFALLFRNQSISIYAVVRPHTFKS